MREPELLLVACIDAMQSPARELGESAPRAPTSEEVRFLGRCMAERGKVVEGCVLSLAGIKKLRVAVGSICIGVTPTQQSRRGDGSQKRLSAIIKM